MKIKSAAKINLSLDVTGRLDNGYHTIESVFQTVGLYDEITVEKADSISISCTVPEQFAAADPIPCDNRNIAYKAAELFFSQAGISGGCNIHILKGIPSQAGMGGGSTDAAGVLYCLNKVFSAGLSAEQLAELGKNLGADVPFFFSGGTAFVSGIGEKLTPLPDFSGRILVIAKGSQGVSTADAYRNVDALTEPFHPQTAALADAIKNAPETAYQFFGNIFEAAVGLEEVDKLKSAMLNKDALKANMTGSGSAVFGLFETLEAAEICCSKLKSWGYFAAVCETVNSSFIELD